MLTQSLVGAAQELVVPAHDTMPMHTPAPDLPRPLPGTSWMLTRKLGAGGMSEIYLAEHRDFGRRVAIKLLCEELSSSHMAMERLRREALLATQVAHPRVVEIYDIGVTAEGRTFLVMEYVEGRNLLSVIRTDAPMAPERVVRLCRHLCEVLQVAHDQGVIHRDLKPENILIQTLPDGAEQVTLLDFGVAHALRPELARLTLDDHTVGTPGYIAPEQACALEVDGRCDQYGLAMIAYEALTGRNPYQRDDPVSTVRAQIELPAPPMSAMGGVGVPPALDRVVRRGLSRRAKDRYATMTTFAEALARAIEISAPRQDQHDALPKRSASRPSWSSASRMLRLWHVALAALLGAVLALVALHFVRQIEAPIPTRAAPAAVER